MKSICFALACLMLPAGSALAQTSAVESESADIGRYKCVSKHWNFGTRTEAKYIKVRTVDLGSTWMWTADRRCGSILLEGPLFHTDVEHMDLFPKVWTSRGGWRGTFAVDYAGTADYVAKALTPRYHILPKELGEVTSVRVDVKYDMTRNHASLATVEYGERDTIAYDRNGRLVRFIASINSGDHQNYAYTLLDCRDPQSACEADVAKAD
ncbi:MAG: hypothetical protein QM639_10935 [Rhodocyclaceae bacterium]